MSFTVAIAGASGNVGGELLRLIAKHPELELKTVTASSMAGEKVGSLHPQVEKYAEHVFVENTAENLAGHDIVFLALPHSKSAEVAQWLSDETLVLDCGADFRLESAEDWAKFYGGEHAGIVLASGAGALGVVLALGAGGGGGGHRLRHAVGRKDQPGAGRHVLELLDEHGALGAQAVDDIAVVDDLVADVDGLAADLESLLDDVDGAHDAQHLTGGGHGDACPGQRDRR